MPKPQQTQTCRKGSQTPSKERYPSPGPQGGRLIRQVVAELRQENQTLPITSHILIAASGGADSTALAHLLLKYGRRVAPAPNLSLLHINHGWRGAESDGDEAFVRELGEKWKVPVKVHRLAPPKKGTGESLEAYAREQRKSVFAAEVRSQKATILTAHHADDLAETLLWRLLTGSAQTHGAGILPSHGVELRPLLSVRKEALKAYLHEEAQSWREDATNHEGRLLRSKMRGELMPAMERLFPRAVEHLVQAARRAQALSDTGVKNSSSHAPSTDALAALFQASGLKMRRANWEEIAKSTRSKGGTVLLPGGWRLHQESGRNTRQKSSGARWILEDLGEVSGD